MSKGIDEHLFTNKTFVCPAVRVGILEFYQTDAYYIASTTILFVSLGMLGIGFYWKNRDAHIVSIAGWETFSLFWLLQIPHFWLDVNDPINVSFCAASLPFFSYLSYHEWLSREWGEDNKSLKFMRGSTFVAGAIYFVIDKIPFAAAALIYAVAWQTSMAMRIIGWDLHPGDIVYTGKEVYVPVVGSSISIILACTAVEAIVIFIAAIYCTAAPRNRRIKALLYTVPTIWLGNLVRNASIIYLVDSHALADAAISLGVSEFELAHTYLGKGGSFGVLIILAFVVFKVMPEVYDNIIGLVDLTIRQRSRSVRLKLCSFRGTTIEKSLEGASKLDIPDTDAEVLDISTSSVNLFYPELPNKEKTEERASKKREADSAKNAEREGLYIYASLLSRDWTKDDMKMLIGRIGEVRKERGMKGRIWLLVNGAKYDALELAIEKGAVVSQLDDVLALESKISEKGAISSKNED